MTADIYPADQISHAEIDALVAGIHHDPHAALGGHPGPDGVTIRALATARGDSHRGAARRQPACR